MNWMIGYLKMSGFWFLVLFASMLFLYFEKPFWSLTIWLAQISYQLILISVLIVARSEKQ